MNGDPKPTCCAEPEAEVTATRATVPIWLVTLTMVLFFIAAWVFDLRGGWFEPKVYAPFTSVAQVQSYQPRSGDDVWRDRGKFLYEQNCGQCHANDGAGKPGQAPPFAGSEWVLTKGVNRLIRIPLAGLAGPITVKGQPWNLNMAAMGLAYNDDDLAAVLSYIRNSFGNQASVVTPEQVKKVRADLAGRTLPYTAEELLKLEE
jgi:mono/diheme cytochrome c family protein